jgi:hypothetical protein
MVMYFQVLYCHIGIKLINLQHFAFLYKYMLFLQTYCIEEI